MNSRVIILLVVIVLVIGGAISIGALQRNSQSNTGKTKQITLTDYAQQDVSVRFTTEGPITANENHTMSIIEVSRNTRNYDRYKTYTNTSVQSKTYPNNQTAFEDLLYGLQRAGFTSAKNGTSAEDPRGYCPTGSRYTYELIQNDQVIVSLWSNSCKTKQATFNGSDATIQTLLQRQIPDYATLSVAK